MTKQNKYKLVPPHIHHINAVERAIRIWIFFNGLEIIDTKLPASEWDHIIPQAVININIL